MSRPGNRSMSAADLALGTREVIVTQGGAFMVTRPRRSSARCSGSSPSG